MNRVWILFFIANFFLVGHVARCDVMEPGKALRRTDISVPYFYDFFKDGKLSDIVTINKKYLLQFYGKNFAKSDLVKLVLGNTSCKHGNPAGGFVPSTVTVRDDKMVSRVNFVVTEIGSYAICYYHTTNTEWVEVSARAGRPIPTEEEIISTTAPTPQCPVLPTTMHQYPFDVVEVTVERPSGSKPREVLRELSAFVAKLLCLSDSDIGTIQFRSFEHAGNSNSTKITWYFTLLCLRCDFLERINYLPYYFRKKSEDFYKIGITSVEGSYHVPVDIGEAELQKHSRVLLFLASVFFVMGGGLFLFGALKYKERREQFEGLDNGFGLLDGDMEDLFPAVPEGIAALAHNEETEGENVTNNAKIGFIEVEE